MTARPVEPCTAARRRRSRRPARSASPRVGQRPLGWSYQLPGPHSSARRRSAARPPAAAPRPTSRCRIRGQSPERHVPTRPAAVARPLVRLPVWPYTRAAAEACATPRRANNVRGLRPPRAGCGSRRFPPAGPSCRSSRASPSNAALPAALRFTLLVSSQWETLQFSSPPIRSDLQNRRVWTPVLGLHPLPKTSLSKLSAQLVFSPEPLLSSPDSIRVNLVQEGIISFDDSVFPYVPETCEIVAETHGAFVVGVRVVSSRLISASAGRTLAPVRVQIRVDVLCWMSGHLLKRRSKIRIRNMLDSDFE